MITTNPSDPFGHFTQKRVAPQRRVTSFLEAFKENAASRQGIRRPGSFAEAFKKSATAKQDVIMSSGDLRPGSALSVDAAVSYEEAKKREEQARQQERMIARQHEEEERARLENKHDAVKKEIESLRESILKIAKSAGNVSHEIEKAAFETPVAPGTYHLSFFKKLQSTLELVKKSLDDSASWLHTMNERNKKTPFFWAQVKKSGTKYMLSSERYMQMSAG